MTEDEMIWDLAQLVKNIDTSSMHAQVNRLTNRRWRGERGGN